jgi:hypothetical protein
LPVEIFDNAPLHINNVLGDWIGLVGIFVAYWIIFARCENMSWNKFEAFLEGSYFHYFFIYRYPNKVPED